LLATALEEENKVGIAHFVMRTKQYLAAIRPKDGHLVLSTMVYADEINEPDSIPELEELEEVDLSDKELEMARQLIESLGTEFEPEKFHDTYREAVLGLIEKKAAGEEIVMPAAEVDSDKVIDLMAALEASVSAAKQARTRHPTSHDTVAEKPGRKRAAKKSAAKAPAKKTAAKKTAAARKSA
jgi:DNA end-binding protein Ku